MDIRILDGISTAAILWIFTIASCASSNGPEPPLLHVSALVVSIAAEGDLSEIEIISNGQWSIASPNLSETATHFSRARIAGSKKNGK